MIISPSILVLPLAHVQQGPRDVHELLRSWEFEPFVWIGLALSAWPYVRGLRRLWQEAGIGHGVKRWEACCYAGGWLALFAALASPLHPWGRVLFSVHMTQHEVLMLLAAPLIVLGRPIIVFLKAIPASWARRLAKLSNTRAWRTSWGLVSSAVVAWLLHAVILWVWHVPALFEATLDSELVHTLQHASFLGSALLFWWAVMHDRGRAVAYGMAILYMYTTAIHSGLLGVLIALTRTVWYPAYTSTAPAWGLTALEDQQLGGLIMWIPAGVVYLVAGLAFMAGWMREAERRAQLREMAQARQCSAVPVVPILLIGLVMIAGCDSGREEDGEKERLSALTGGGDPELGKRAIQYHGCVSCHTIPGIPGADALVGPSLERIGSRAYVGGVVPNTPDNLVRWIRNAPAVDPDTAMPNLRIEERDARDIASYLYTLRQD